MTHTSGLQFISDWCKHDSITLQQSVEGIGKGGKVNGQFQDPAEMLFKPGQQIQYSDVGMQVAGGMAEKAAKTPWSKIFKEKIGDPC